MKKNSPSENRRRVFISKLIFISENVFYVPVSVAVTPDPVQVSVAAIVEPPVFPYKNVIMMMFEHMQRFVKFGFYLSRRQNFRFRGSFYAGYAHDANQGCNCQYT